MRLARKKTRDLFLWLSEVSVFKIVTLLLIKIDTSLFFDFLVRSH